MSKIPRLLPLAGVAIGGVIAVNALSGAHNLPQLLSPIQAMAEETLNPKSGKHAKTTPDPAAAADSATPKAQSSLPPGVAGQPGAASVAAAPVCAASATDLARQAGMSPAELQVLQSLQTRRGQIDDREKDLDTEVQLLAAAEAKLDGKIKSMNGLKADIQALMGQADVKTQAEVDRLVIVYSKMRPQDAAAVMAQLDDKVRLPIAAGMKPKTLSDILGKMGTLEAKDLTEKLAHKFAPVQALAQAATAPIPPGSTPPPANAQAAPPAKTPPGKTPPAKAVPDAAAEDVADAAPVDAKAKPAVKPRPKRIAKAAPKKAPPKPKTPEADAKAADPATPSKPQPYTALKDQAPAAPSAPASAKSS